MSKAVETLIRNLQKQVKAAALDDYRAQQQTRYDLYAGCYKPYVIEYLKGVCPETWQEFIPIYLPLYRKVVDKRAGGLYRKAPERTWRNSKGEPVEDKVAHAIEEAYRPAYVNTILDKAARYLESHRTILITIVWRHNRIEFDVLPPTLFHVVQGYPDPTMLEDAEALILYNRTRTDTPSVSERDTRTVWQRHSDTAVEQGTPAFYVVDGNEEVLEEGTNPYLAPTRDGKGWEWHYPAILLHLEDPDGTLYLPGGDELTDGALSVAFSLTDHFFIERYQGFGQPVFWGVNEIKDLALGPTHAIKLKDKTQQDFDFRAPPGKGTERLENLRKFLNMFAVAMDVPANTFDETSTPPSGVSRRIASADLIEHRDALAQRLARYEELLFERMRVVWNTHSAEVKRIPWDVSLTVTPAPQSLPIDPLEEDARTEKRASLGLLSIVDVLVNEQGITREDALARLRRNREENGMLSNDAPVISMQEKLMLAGVLSPVDLIMAARGVERAEAEVILAQNRKDLEGSALLAQAGGSAAANARDLAGGAQGAAQGAPAAPGVRPATPPGGTLRERMRARMEAQAKGTGEGAGGEG